jgi:RNA polymerase-associated protein CTR9
MGNFYFSNLYTSQHIPTPKYDDNLKQSYKYYHHLLDEDKTKSNLYAANGLGMVCAEKGEFDAAREIFAKVREAAPAHNVSATINLAHVHLYQQHFADAIHLYQMALKSADFSLKSELLECLGLAYFKNRQFDEAITCVQRALNYSPSSLHLVFNLAYLREEHAVVLMEKGTRSVKDTRAAIAEFKIAKRSLEMLLACDSSERSRAMIRSEILSPLDAFCKVFMFTINACICLCDSNDDDDASPPLD